MIRHALAEPLNDRAGDFVRDMFLRSFASGSVEVVDTEIHADPGPDTAREEAAQLIDRLAFVARGVDEEVLYDRRGDHVDTTGAVDPQPALEACGDVRPVAPGLFLLQGDFWRVQCALQDYMMDIARRYEAVEQDYPALWPVDLYRKIDYFAEFPHQVIMAAPVREDFATRDHFAREHGKGSDFDHVRLGDDFAGATFGLQSAVCDCCYYALEHARDFEDTVYTTSGKVFRNENSPGDSLERLTSFSVRDIMFVGAELFVRRLRRHMVDEAVTLLGALDLDARIVSANDAFFGNEATLKTAFQYASHLKHELLVRLPHNGTDLAVGSINLHLDFFGRTFDIRLPDDTPACSGCFGLGFERLTYALFCRYGSDLESWPPAITRFLGVDADA